jgi:hypothetical protein
MATKQKRSDNVENKSADVDVSQLTTWAKKGGSGVPAKAEPESFQLRYTTDMFGLVKILTDLADMAEACRVMPALRPSEREEKAIDKLKFYANGHAIVFRRGGKPEGDDLLLTMTNAQRLLDGMKVDYERYIAGAFVRFDERCKIIRDLYPRLLDGRNAERLAMMQDKFRQLVAANGKVKPVEKILAYKDIHKFLRELDDVAHKQNKRQQQRKEEASERRQVAEDIFAAIDRL